MKQNTSFFFPLNNFIHSVKNNVFCRVVLHITLLTSQCLGNKSKNKLKRLKPSKTVVNIYISKLGLDRNGRNPAKK